ncbi:MULTISPECIES: hypothetical protein [unclassified Endozoicomonas]|uniref:hypothetical protein n=1 Tax=unclassified Endozoicomonas TaxID=2644528 RepID=UPI0021487BA5|nr:MULTISPECIES: hypothetical protein [unclassified Endozoicomonas]
MEEIALGSINSKFYEKNGEQYYKISPILGQQINFFLDAPVSEIKVLKSTEQELVIKRGRLKLKMAFKPYVPGLQKLRLMPIYFDFLPMGVYFCEISETNKNRLLGTFGNS